MYYPGSENKGADQLRGYREADLRLCFRIYAKSRFSHDAAQVMLRNLSDPLREGAVSRVMRKSAFCIYVKTKAQISCCAYHAAFRYIHVDSTIPMLHQLEIASLQSSSVVVQFGLCRTWSETPKTALS